MPGMASREVPPKEPR